MGSASSPEQCNLGTHAGPSRNHRPGAASRPAVADLAQHDRCERGSEQHPIHNGFMVVRNGVAIQDRHIERVVRVNGYRSRERKKEHL